MNLNLEATSVGLIILFFMVSINYTGTTLNCSLQYYFLNSRLTKSLLIFFVIFIFIVIANPKFQNENPFKILKTSIPIYLIYILATKNQPQTLVTFLILWFCFYFVYLYKNYKFKHFKESQLYIFDKNFINDIKNKNKNIDQKKINEYIMYQKIQLNIFIISIVVLVYGFFSYLNDKKTEYNKNWSWYTFILGSKKCKSLKTLS